MRRKLYIAYGSNLNKAQMAWRCPTARYVGTGMVEGYELKFKGRPEGAYATIDPKKGGRVPVAIWEIQPYDEFRLNQYEGYPNHYFTRDIPVKIGNHEVTGMVYIMNLRAQANLPAQHYYDTVEQGYKRRPTFRHSIITILWSRATRIVISISHILKPQRREARRKWRSAKELLPMIGRKMKPMMKISIRVLMKIIRMILARSKIPVRI